LVKILVGSKIDLKRVVDTRDGLKLANKYNMLFIECSAKNNINIESIFVGALYNIRETGISSSSNKHDPMDFSKNKTPVTLRTNKIEINSCCN